jgi:gamma-glutamylcyclotransferase (GGCT)/AIG2-like uncharacterized protein YtfP
MSTNSIFICSAMFEGNSFLSRLQNLIVSSESGTIQASVYRSKVGFPVLCKAVKDSIRGTVLRLASSEMAIHIMDELMGFSVQNPSQSLTVRESIAVTTGSGTEEAFAYFLNPGKINNDVKYIENGDWEKVLTEKPPIPNKLNERQRNYIQKLGKSSGRDIVPIDLALYRELMNLELVIDKGRRIALTKLGQEVYRYL